MTREELRPSGFGLSRLQWVEKQVEMDDTAEEAITKYIETVPRDSFSQRAMTERLALSLIHI